MLRFLVWTCLTAGFLIAPAIAFGQTGKDIKGVVQEVDAVTGTMTLIVEDGFGAQGRKIKTFNLQKPDIPVTTAEGKTLKLAEIPADQRVYLVMAGEDVSAVRLAPPTLFGTLIKVNSKDRTVTVSSKFGDKTVTILATAKIIENHEAVALESVKPGTVARVSFSEDLKTVLELRTGKGLMPLVRVAKNIGYLIDVDHDKRTAKILNNVQAGGDQLMLRDLSFAKDASFGLLYRSRPYRELRLSEVERGVKVHYWTDFTTKKILHLEVEMPILGLRTVKSFDPARRRLVLEDSEGDKVLTLSPSAKVFLGGRPAKQQEIQPNSQVTCGLSANRQMVEVVYVSKK